MDVTGVGCSQPVFEGWNFSLDRFWGCKSFVSTWDGLCWPHAWGVLLQQITMVAKKPLKSCLATGLALHHSMEGASGSGWRKNLPKKRQESPKAHFHASPRARLSPGVWASCGKAGTWNPNKTKQLCPFSCCPFSLLPFLLQTNPAQKFKDLHQALLSPTQRLIHAPAWLQGNWKHLASCCISSKVSISLVAVMNPPRNWNFKMNNQGGFFPHCNFFFPPGKVISQKFCWTLLWLMLPSWFIPVKDLAAFSNKWPDPARAEGLVPLHLQGGAVATGLYKDCDFCL